MELKEFVLLGHALETFDSTGVDEDALKEHGFELTEEKFALIQKALRKKYDVLEDCTDEEMYAHESRLMEEMRKVVIEVIIEGFAKIESYLSE